MAIVAGVDFGTLSVRVSLVDAERGRLGSAVAAYPLLRSPADPRQATQRPGDHLNAFVAAMRDALAAAKVSGSDVQALAVATTGSTVMPVDDRLRPLDDYSLWCDHRASREAAEITRVAHEMRLPTIAWYGGVYSPQMGWAKTLHWLRHHPDQRARLATVVEHCEMIVAQLVGATDVKRVPRSACARGHKWLWRPDTGYPAETFFRAVDPLLEGLAERMAGPCATSDQVAGGLSEEWAGRLGLRPGIPVPFPALDAHWDAIGAGIAEGDIINVVGTSTCIMGIVRETQPIPGVCGVVPGSIHPAYHGIEAGLSAAGDLFDAISRRYGSTVAELSRDHATRRPGATGLLRLVWDNGDRTVLGNPDLAGVTLGWNLQHTGADELFAAIEGTGFHTRIVLERMAEHGVPMRRVINAGGIPQRNATLNQVYADILGKPILVPRQEVTSLGSAIFAFLAAGAFKYVGEAQRALCPTYHVVEPRSEAVRTYEELFGLYRTLYFGLGVGDSALGNVLPRLHVLASRSEDHRTERSD